MPFFSSLLATMPIMVRGWERVEKYHRPNKNSINHVNTNRRRKYLCYDSKNGRCKSCFFFCMSVLAVAPPVASESWAPQVLRLIIRHPRPSRGKGSRKRGSPEQTEGHTAMASRTAVVTSLIRRSRAGTPEAVRIGPFPGSSPS